MPYAELPGVRLWYTDSGGNGTPVIFLHAGSGSTESWVHQLPAFSAAGYRCIAYDRLGWGRSEPDASGKAGFVSEDLRGLADRLGITRMHVIGTSAGAPCAVDYALTHPERVRSLVICDGTGGVQDPEYVALLERIRTPEIDALPVELRELSASYRGADPEGARRWLEIERAARPNGGHTRSQRPRHEITFGLLEKLAVPTLVLVGDADLRTPPSQMRLLAAHIPGSQFATVPEAGHAAFWEQPEVWNRIVLEFMAPH